MKILLYAIEGLGLSLPYFDATYLRTLLLPKITGAEIIVSSWLQGMPTLSHTLDQKVILVGHSFGAAAICDAQPYADLIVTIDPRWDGFDSFSTGSKLNWFNFYERNMLFNLPGDAVAGATNTELNQYEHVTIPSAPEIASMINAWIKDNS